MHTHTEEKGYRSSRVAINKDQLARAKKAAFKIKAIATEAHEELVRKETPVRKGGEYHLGNK